MLETKRGVCALNWQDSGRFLWRPDIRPRLNEWVADFALAGQAALDGPKHASRMVMFRMFYLGLSPYDTARHFLGLSEMSWVKWSEDVRRRCFQELLRRENIFAMRRDFNRTERCPHRLRGFQSTKASPTRRGLPCSVPGTRVLVARR